MPPLSAQPDATLVRLLAAAPPEDADALEALYLRHREWALRVAFRFCRDEGLAHDAVQEAFLYVARKGAGGMVLSAQFTTFLYPALKHEAEAARRKALRLASDAALPEPEAPPVREETDLAPLLARLPAEQCEALLLRFVDGLSIAEVAAATATPEGTVKTRLFHAIRKLRADPATAAYFGVAPSAAH